MASKPRIPLHSIRATLLAAGQAAVRQGFDGAWPLYLLDSVSLLINFEIMFSRFQKNLTNTLKPFPQQSNMDKKPYQPCDLVIYGALGDLSRRKLLISLYRLENANLIEPDTRIIGIDRHETSNAEFIETARHCLQEFSNEITEDGVWIAIFRAAFVCKN